MNNKNLVDVLVSGSIFALCVSLTDILAIYGFSYLKDSSFYEVFDKFKYVYSGFVGVAFLGGMIVEKAVINNKEY